MLAYISGQPDRKDPYISLLPTGLCYLHAALLEAGYDAVLANFSGMSPRVIRHQLRQHAPSVVGISQWTHNRHDALKLATLVKECLPGCAVIMGGSHATYCYEAILQRHADVDVVVLGEGERTLLQLVGRLQYGAGYADIGGLAFRKEGKVVATEPAGLIEELDALPFSCLGLEKTFGVDQRLQAEFIVTSRGCPSACNFCCSPVFWQRRVRFRSPRHIVDEIKAIRKRYGLIYFSLRDDTFTADRQRVIEFCRLLIEEQLCIVWNCQSRVSALDEELLIWMKRAGCECVQLGIESGSEAMLAYLGKKITLPQIEAAAAMIKTAGINLSIYLISDMPGERDQDVDATIALIKKIRPDDGYVSPLAYYPGTRLFEKAVSAGEVAGDIFDTERAQAVYALKDHGRNAARVLGALTRYSSGTAKNFSQQKLTQGYCHVTNIMAGEYYLGLGQQHAAEKEFREITEAEPHNPWGWYLLGELLEASGNITEAAVCFRRALEIVPRHQESLLAAERVSCRG